MTRFLKRTALGLLGVVLSFVVANAQGTWSGAQTVTVTGTVVRDPQNQPGSNASVWNTPFGSGATWSAPTDAATLAICGPTGQTPPTCAAFINSVASFGQTRYVGASTDGQYVFNAASNGRTIAPDNGSTLTATLHVPTGAITPGPYGGGDTSFILMDQTNAPNKQYTFGGVRGGNGVAPPGLQPGQGPFPANAGEWDDITSNTYGQDYDTGLSGFNIGAGLITACDVNPSCNPVYPKIQHALRYSMDARQLLSNSLNSGTNVLNPSGWPDRLEDFQSGINIYTGQLLAGSSLGIPSTTAMPAGLDANCQGLFRNFQHYPTIFRDQAGGGFHLTVDQVADTSAWTTSARGCLPQLVGLLRRLTNQHPGGTSFVTNPANGPGTRVDTGPPALGLAGGGNGGIPGMTHGFMNYQTLLLNYTGTGTRSPIFVYEHENDEGNSCYQGGSCTSLSNSIAGGGAGPQDWYNTAGFQNRYCLNGCIIAMPYADQTSDPSGQTSSFGGYGDTPGSEPNERGVIAVIQHLLSTLNADPSRVYVTGDSLGGIGSQAIGLDFGIRTGSQGQVVTATMPFSGAIFRNGLNAPTNTQLAQIQGGGLQFNINGIGDTGTSSNPALWSDPLWKAITGNTNYPGPPAGGVAGSSPVHYLKDPNLGHDVWDTYRPMPAGTPMLDLLFAQTGAPVTPPSNPITGVPKSPLPSGYLHTVGNQIVDGSGNNIRLACSGYNEPTGNFSSDMNIMRNQGFNCARYPWYDRTLSLTTMDAIVAAATANNMKIIFDHHGNEQSDGNNFCLSQQKNGLWYDVAGPAPFNTVNGNDGCGNTGTVTYAQFKANWITIANRYKGNSTVIAFDLHNEPINYGLDVTIGTNWGGGNGSDMRAMVNDVGAALVAADPGVLLIVEAIGNNGTLFNGVTRGSPTYPITGGVFGDLTTVSTFPPTCCAGTIVYSPHEYPGSISSTQPDSGPGITTMRNTTYGYLVTNNIAPVWIGEMGADLDNSNGQVASEQAWAASITQYLNGQLGAQGGPTFTGCQQPISADWWAFGNLSGQVPDGTLNPDGSNKAGQQAVWNTLLYTTCSGTPPVNPPNPPTPPIATTWNPADSTGTLGLSGSNLIATSTVTGSQSVRSTTSQTGGKVCFEVGATAITNNWDVGLANAAYVLNVGNGLGGDTNGIGYDPNSAGGFQGVFFNNAILSHGLVASGSGEPMTECADLDAHLLWVTSTSMRGVSATNPFSTTFSADFGGTTTSSFSWNNSTTANPATGVGGIPFAGLNGPYFVTFNTFDAGSVATLNATGPFAVSTPAGFNAWQLPATGGSHPFILVFW